MTKKGSNSQLARIKIFNLKLSNTKLSWIPSSMKCWYLTRQRSDSNWNRIYSYLRVENKIQSGQKSLRWIRHELAVGYWARKHQLGSNLEPAISWHFNSKRLNAMMGSGPEPEMIGYKSIFNLQLGGKGYFQKFNQRWIIDMFGL